MVLNHINPDGRTIGIFYGKSNDKGKNPRRGF